MSDFTDKLSFTEIRPGVELAPFVGSPVEVQVVKISAGTEVGSHTHSDDVVHLVISGRLKIGDTEIGPLGDYRCGGWEYRPMALEDTIMLIIQKEGTTFTFSDD